MPGIASNRVSPPLYQRQARRGPRSEAKRTRIIDAATQHFAEHGYHAARVGDIADRPRHRQGIDLPALRQQGRIVLRGLQAGGAFVSRVSRCSGRSAAEGFFEVLRYWLVRTEHLLHEDWIPYRISLLGNYGTDLVLKREINRFLISGRSVRHGELRPLRPGARRTSQRHGSSR